ncbi:MAG TPA: DUF1697 domain-containing protein [Acidobacteriaceae bacterium]|jgi:uncharacterized protein (DUF1697 family)|nr:DUF1697 domain-containing protein [Acidobacteriaceae bacterium]
MGTYIALLRGINVVGANQLAMKDLVSLCCDCGFRNASTWINSGNAIFESKLGEAAIQKKLETALAAKMTKPVAVMIRTPAQLQAALKANPFPGKDGSKVLIAFLAVKVPADALKNLATPGGEQVRTGERVIYVYYPDGMGQSRLRLNIKGASMTMRNVNTVAKLVALSEARSPA